MVDRKPWRKKTFPAPRWESFARLQRGQEQKEEYGNSFFLGQPLIAWSNFFLVAYLLRSQSKDRIRVGELTVERDEFAIRKRFEGKEVGGKQFLEITNGSYENGETITSRVAEEDFQGRTVFLTDTGWLEG